MARTDRLTGLLTRGAAFGGLLIAYVRFFPVQISAILDAPLYVGYQISILFALAIGLLMGVYYISSVIKDEADRLEENITSEELREILEESVEENEDVSTDGGRPITDGNGRGDRNGIIRTPDLLIDRFIIEPSGRGALAGIVLGVLLGFLFGQNGIIIGGFLGAIIGNEIEYQAIRKKRKSVLGIEMHQGSVNEDLLYDLLKHQRVRQALRILFREHEELSLSNLAEEIIRKENDTVSTKEKKSVYVSLYQEFLPRLEEAGIVDWDASTGVVSLGKNSEEIKPYIEEGSPQFDVSESIFYDILKNRRRRIVLETLLEESQPMELSELSERVAAIENEIPREELSAKERKSVYTALYQTHLPKLDDAGFINYDRENGIIELEDQTKNLGEPRFRIPKSSFSWDFYYAVLSVTFILIFVTREIGMVPYSSEGLKILFVIYASLVSIPALYKVIMKGHQ